MLKNFLESRIEKWKRLEELTTRASKLRLTNLTGEEVREFGRLYRRTAADLAIAREEVRDQRLVNYLNHLVARAHGAIYRSESSGFGVFFSFFRYDFPAAFRKAFRYILTSFLAFLLPCAFAILMCYVDEGFADPIAPGMREKIAAHENWTKQINEANPIYSSAIQINNIQVTFLAFAGGILAGVGTLVVLASNGLSIGVIVGLCIRHGHWDILTFMSGHGVIELSAIFISGGAGLLIGKALLMPGDLRRIDALVTNGLLELVETMAVSRDAVRLMKAAEFLGKGLEREEFERHIDVLMVILADLFHLKLGDGGHSLTNSDVADRLERMAEPTSFDEIARWVDGIEKVLQGLSRNLNRQLAMEAVLVGTQM